MNIFKKITYTYILSLVTTSSFSAEIVLNKIPENCRYAVKDVTSRFIPNNSTANANIDISQIVGSNVLAVQIEVSELEDSNSYFVHAAFSPTTTGCNISYSFVKYSKMSCNKITKLPMTNIAGNDYMKLSAKNQIRSYSRNILKFKSNNKNEPYRYWFLQSLENKACNIIETNNTWKPKTKI